MSHGRERSNCQSGHRWSRRGNEWRCDDCGEAASSRERVHSPCIQCGGPTEGPGHPALCDACFEKLRAVAEAKEVVSGTARDRQLSKRELDKLDKALFSAVAQNISGKAQHLFQVLVDLRATRELAEGRLVPGPGAMLITGVDEYLQELVEEAYRLLGIPARA